MKRLEDWALWLTIIGILALMAALTGQAVEAVRLKKAVIQQYETAQAYWDYIQVQKNTIQSYQEIVRDQQKVVESVLGVTIPEGSVMKPTEPETRID